MNLDDLPDLGLPRAAAASPRPPRSPARGLRRTNSARAKQAQQMPHPQPYKYTASHRSNNSMTSNSMTSSSGHSSNNNNNNGSNSSMPYYYDGDHSVNSFSTAGLGIPQQFYDEGTLSGDNSQSTGMDADFAAIESFKATQQALQQARMAQSAVAQGIPPPPPRHMNLQAQSQDDDSSPDIARGAVVRTASFRRRSFGGLNPQGVPAEHKVHDGSGKRKKWKIGLAVGVVVAILVGVVGAVAGGGGGGDSGAAHPDKGTIEDDNMSLLANHPTRIPEVLAYIIDLGWTSADTLDNKDSPQYRAAEWLADYDQLEVEMTKKGEFRDRYALAVFYFATEGDRWRYRINWMSTHEACLWSAMWPGLSGREIKVGVICQDRTNVVTKLFLPSMEMKGSIPPELKLLTGLEEIDFYKNSLSGPIPTELQVLKELKTFILHNNDLTGPVPDWFATSTPKLVTVDLAMNKLTGTLPGQLNQLSVLKTLNLENNLITGTLDPLHHQMPALQYLSLGNNQIGGRMEATLLGNWPQITDLDMSDNALTGQLPSLLFSVDTLLVIDLHGNDFEGHLPGLIDLDAKVEFVSLHENRLSGPIDHRITRLANLHHLDLSRNSFTGVLPPDISDLYNLKYLFLAFNKELTPGPIPVEWTERLTQLQDLSLQETGRTGVIPTQMGEMSSLVLLDLAGNELTGNIPSQIGDLRHLKFLVLKDNKLSGEIPESFQHLSRLDTAVLDDNDLTGGAAHMCTPKLPALVEFISDCQETVCSCCSLCCVDGTTCNDRTWFAQLDPVTNYQFARVFYKFNEEDVIYPVPEAEEISENYDKFGVPGGVR